MMRGRSIALSLGAACLLPATAHAQEAVVYPAVTEAGVHYAIRADDGGKITQCDRVTGEPSPSVDAAACEKLIAKGVPAGLQPARSLNSPRDWISYTDYPQLALQRGESGMVEYLMEVDVQGRVSDCIARIPSGSKIIDRAVCQALKERARFSPATYRGKPVPAVSVGRAGMWMP